MAKILRLSSLIHGQFGSEAEFASHIGWSRQRLNKIVNGTKKPSVFDAQAIADGLGIPVQIVVDIFLTEKSTN